MLKISKTRIDKAGRLLADPVAELTGEFLELDEVFDAYRRSFLGSLTDLTGQIQSWLTANRNQYYIAQRLRRRPQILRKLRRLSVRLAQ